MKLLRYGYDLKAEPPAPLQPGEKGFLLFAATEVEILGSKSDTASHTMYEVLFSSGHKMLAGLDEVVRATDPMFLFVQQCKLYMHDLGYRALALGIDADLQWRSFCFNEPEEYNKLVHSNKDIQFRYYWALNR